MKRTEPERIEYLYKNLQEELLRWMCKYYFEEPDEIDIRESYWIGGGTILWISDIFVNMEDIIYLATNNVPRDTFCDWYWHTVENHDNHLRCNIQSYIKLRGDWTHEEFIKFQEDQHAKRQAPEYKKKVKEELEKSWDDGIAKLEKHIGRGT